MDVNKVKVLQNTPKTLKNNSKKSLLPLVFIFTTLNLATLPSYAYEDYHISNHRYPHHYYSHQWIVEPDYFPSNALAWTHNKNGETLYVCKAYYGQGVFSGRVLNNQCSIAFHGREIRTPDYQILVGGPFRWMPSFNENIPPNAVSGEYENDQSLYVCRINYKGGKIPGYVRNGYCHVANWGQEIMRADYEILVSPTRFVRWER